MNGQCDLEFLCTIFFIIIHTELLVAKIKSCIPRGLWGGQYFLNIGQAIFFYSIIALRFQPIRRRHRRWLYPNNHLLKMNNHLPLQFTPAILYLGWFAVFVLAVPRYPLDLVNLFIAVSLQVKTFLHVLAIIE